MSSSRNKAQLIGNLGRDPELRATQNGSSVATLSVATSESWTDSPAFALVRGECLAGRLGRAAPPHQGRAAPRNAAVTAVRIVGDASKAERDRILAHHKRGWDGTMAGYGSEDG